jgi:hypothetical protein
MELTAEPFVEPVIEENSYGQVKYWWIVSRCRLKIRHKTFAHRPDPEIL